MRLPTCALWSILASILCSTIAVAAIVDDFSAGQLQMHVARGEPRETFNQVDLDLKHVVGGRRGVAYNVYARDFDAQGGVSVEIDPIQGTFTYSADPGLSAANFTLNYGDNQRSLNSNLAEDGENSLVFDFDYADFETGTGAFDIRIMTEGESRGSFVMFRNSMTPFSVVLPFLEFDNPNQPANFTDVQYINFGTGNGLLPGRFRLSAVRTARYPDGDYNFDGTVSVTDFDVWRREFGQPATSVPFAADGNRDRQVNAADYTIWRDYLSSLGASAHDATIVPEPQWIVTFVTGSISTILIGRNKL